MPTQFRKSICPVLLSISLTSVPGMGVAQDLYGMQPITPAQPAYRTQVPRQTQETYGEQVGHKAVSGLANVTTGWFEIPKNIINTTNASNLIYGVTGGTFKGLVNTVGRMLCGITDLLTAPLPTEPVPNPEFVWNDFDVDTTYGDVFRLKQRAAIQAAATPAESIAPESEPEPEATSEPLDTAADRVEDAAQETDRKLDSMFKHYMTK